VTRPVPRIALTPGEPAGIGPDLCLALAGRAWPAELVAIADPALLADRAQRLGLEIELTTYSADTPASPSQPGRLVVASPGQAASVVPGRLEIGNASYVLASLDRACDGCRSGEFDAMTTGPVHKGIINDAGIAFSGHTEYLATRCTAEQPVMLLVADSLRVALVTTHLALRDVPDRITHDRVVSTAGILHGGLRHSFGIESPRILLLGLNPHAGEGGHLGTEELDIIQPAAESLRARAINVTGPLPADTAFTPPQLEKADAVLAMYHDQGLAVLKNRGFGKAVNVTLGLPICRTSVDHGTAVDLAGTGRAHAGSFVAAVELAAQISAFRH
jgi:4-hydroxythreonine-4-phosphate dehydrogenase